MLVYGSFSLNLHAPKLGPKVDLGSLYVQLAAPAYARPLAHPDL